MKIKRNISSFITAAAAVSLLGSSVNAAYDPDKNGKTDKADLKHMLSVFHGETAASAEDDINEDGNLNILDVITLKNNLLSQKADTGEKNDGSYRAVSENVKLIGRTYDDGNVTWLVQSGSAVEFEMSASEAEVVLAGDSAIEAEEKYRPRYAVFVDDELIEDALMSTPEKKVVLLNETSQKTVRVKIIHLSEANNGAVGIKSINVKSSSEAPLIPAAKKDISIEFIGDSITCAYGVEGKSNYDPFMTSTENFMKSYAYLTAQKLGADYSAVSYSGHGIISGYTSTDEKEAGSLVPDCYENIAKLSDYAKPWDFKNNHNDVVVINLGTNDNTYVSKDYDNRAGEFTEAYTEFLKTVRKNNPDAYIICTVGTMGCEEMYPAIEKAVEAFEKSGGKNIMCYLSAVQNPANGYGSDWHPSEITQQMSAYVLADKICSVLGIESDKVGLDAAADAEYDISINEDAGANAATYLGYDKSFWVNMVGGGAEKSDVQILVSGLDLTPGTYRLKFDVTAGKDADIPVSVQSPSGKKYFDGKVSAGTDKISFEEDFVLKSEDSDARLVLEVGGTDYYNVTLANVSLVKTGTVNEK